jgi:hypothetical protein
MPISPSEIRTMARKRQSSLALLLTEINEKLRKNAGTYSDRSYAIIPSEVPVEVRQRIERAYLRMGWSKVTSIVSREDGNHPALTMFEMFF